MPSNIFLLFSRLTQSSIRLMLTNITFLLFFTNYIGRILITDSGALTTLLPTNALTLFSVDLQLDYFCTFLKQFWEFLLGLLTFHHVSTNINYCWIFTEYKVYPLVDTSLWLCLYYTSTFKQLIYPSLTRHTFPEHLPLHILHLCCLPYHTCILVLHMHSLIFHHAVHHLLLPYR